MSLFSKKPLKSQESTRVYFDYAAATPLRPEVLGAMLPYMDDRMGERFANSFANPSAVYAEGREARDAVSASRAQIAEILRVRPEEVIFVSGGTEANNLALIGVVEALHEIGRPYAECEIITTAIEHPSITQTLGYLAKKGVVINKVPVDAEGMIVHAAFEELLSPNTVLVTFAYANSEIGVVQEVRRIARALQKICAAHGYPVPPIHLDASQSPLYLTCELNTLGVSLVTLDAAKCGGPKGGGVLIKKQHVAIRPILFGGSQEEGLRPGTENVPVIVGTARSICLAQKEYTTNAEEVTRLRDYAFEKIAEEIPDAIVNGSLGHRIANNINISIPGIDGEYAAVVLDHHGFAVSTKSACSGASGSGSHVIYALGGDDARALSTLRITLGSAPGAATTKRNIDDLVRVLKGHVTRTRASIDQITKK